jgi:hypothetical protein
VVSLKLILEVSREHLDLGWRENRQQQSSYLKNAFNFIDGDPARASFRLLDL